MCCCFLECLFILLCCWWVVGINEYLMIETLLDGVHLGIAKKLTFTVVELWVVECWILEFGLQKFSLFFATPTL
jgi:hypothetical protein